jgi:pimeloyl-ACP methyl ester carboxylesterase
MNKLCIYSMLPFLILIDWNEGQSQTLDTLISAGKHNLHFRIVKGNGEPILFESGNGDDGSVWENILKPIHDLTGATLVTYDRAGLGKSEIDTTEISFKQEIEDLNEALRSLGFKEGYFLVAHSFGGMYASEFANTNQGKITGAVFIDVSTPCELSDEYTTRVQNSISSANWEMLKEYKSGLYYVLSRFPEIAEYMSQRYIPNSVPLTVVVAEHHKPTQQIGETEQDMLNRRTCLADLGNLPNHRYVVTQNTDHKVWEKDPKTVVEEITKLYRQTKRRKPPR